MIAVDTNILVYAHRPECPFHEAAQRVLGDLAAGPEPWAIPLHCLVEFLGVVTNVRLWRQASTLPEGFAQVAAWRESPHLRLLTEDPTWWTTFEEMSTQAKASGGALHDARIASCCRYNGVAELWTADRDFSRYPALRARNPLVRASS